jgi:succinate-acetate transporter protein
MSNDSMANPAPLGLMGFGMTTILLNIHNAGFYELNTMILAMGIFYGGLAQVIAGLMEFKKGNTFELLLLHPMACLVEPCFPSRFSMGRA